MKAVVQRVKEASVSVDNTVCGEIKRGILVYIGFDINDNDADINWMVNKIPYLRIFSDENGLMNLSVMDLNYDILVISQFTLLGDCKRGRRPSYSRAAKPDMANKMYNKFLELLKKSGLKVESGIFQAHMNVTYNNDGPITIIIDSKE